MYGSLQTTGKKAVRYIYYVFINKSEVESDQTKKIIFNITWREWIDRMTSRGGRQSEHSHQSCVYRLWLSVVVGGGGKTCHTLLHSCLSTLTYLKLKNCNNSTFIVALSISAVSVNWHIHFWSSHLWDCWDIFTIIYSIVSLSIIYIL